MINIDNFGGELKSQLYELNDNSAITIFINNILSDMDPLLTSRQLTELYNVLQKVIQDYSISSDEKLYHDVDYNDLNNDLIESFLEDKRLIGLSEVTLTQYAGSLKWILNYIGKGADTVTADDIRDFFAYLIEERRCSMTTVDNYRRYINSFYNWCVVNGLLYKNPVLKINRVKKANKVKQAFTIREIIYLRENIDNLRDMAIFELLLSSGMRVGELVKLNKTDLNMNECSVIVHGKGNKEREAFFNERAKLSIERYLDSRDDDNPALFVHHNRPHHRLGISGTETMLRNLGEKAGVNKVHPHRFRRHMATSLINKGVHIEQVQKLLGHAEIETTQMYIVNDDDEIRYNHKRYVN